MSERIPERDSYVSLMKERALGKAPEMGSAIRMSEIISTLISSKAQTEISFIDVGCAGGHYLRSIASRFNPQIKLIYTGVDIDPEMIKSAKEAWSQSKIQFPNVGTTFLNASIESEEFVNLTPADVVFSANAFMYFPRPEVALRNMLHLTKQFCVIRSYFCDQTFIVKRAQTNQTHEGSDLAEDDILDENGQPRRYDHWNIYSRSLVEKLVKKVNPLFDIGWEEDRNPTASMKQESSSGIQKFDATQLWNDHEIVYPFILPWEYAILSKK